MEFIEGSKEYYENYARLSLIKLFNFHPNDLILDDKPDIQSKKLDIGIEVVRSQTQQDFFANAISRDYFPLYSDLKTFKQRVTTHYPDFKGTVGMFDNVAYIQHQTGDIKDYLNDVKKKICNKSKKYIQYKHFKTNCLYIFLNHSFLIKEELYKMISNLSSKENFFDIIYINLVDKLIEYKNESITQYDIPVNLIKQLSNEAKYY